MDFKNRIKDNPFIKVAFVLFIIQCIVSFYNSIKIDSIDVLISSGINHFSNFLLLYGVGILIQKKGEN